MTKLKLVDPASASRTNKERLAQINSAFGVTPNMFRTVANSPAALTSMWGAFGALGSGALDAKLGEQIAVAIADRIACSYCLAAHTALGRKARNFAAQRGSSGQATDRPTPKVLGARMMWA
jgi:AhpD family alkylhydroperoxidase